MLTKSLPLFSNLQTIPFIPVVRQEIEVVRGKENPVLPGKTLLSTRFVLASRIVSKQGSSLINVG